MRAFFGRLLGFLVLFCVTMGVWLLFMQHRMIYFPRPYGAAELREAADRVSGLPYATSQGQQRAHYVKPASGPPRRVWMMFAGNGSVALDWLDFVGKADRRDGYLLVDYPGYGACEGSASPGAIAESSEKAAQALALSLGTTVDDLRLCVMGSSLGCATGLNFAARHPVERVVLISPFTTMGAMARRSVGWPLCLLLRHHFDNRARLSELAARAAPPRVIIFHGTSDMTIPDEMGRALAAAHPEMIEFHPVPGAGHNDVLATAESEILASMAEW